MKTEKIETITRKDLVKEIYRLGYTKVKERTVESWQGKDLLPPFDIIGGGRGKGRGRAQNSWSNGEVIIRQAVCVFELMEMYRCTEKVYVPLRMLGFKIPIARLREALTNPVEEGLDELMEKAESFGNLEDALLDSAGEMSEELSRTNVLILSPPWEMLDAIGNILFNPNYDFEDTPFEAGKEALCEWERKLSEAIPAHAEGSDGLLSFDLFDHAQFINRYFSVPAIEKALDECDDDDLERVGQDLEIIGEIGFSLIEFVRRIMPSDFEITDEEAFGNFFKAGTYLALLDLSMRRNGYAGTLDSAREQALKSFREDFLSAISFDSQTEQIFAAAMKELLKLMQKMCEKDILLAPPGEARDFSANFDHGLTMTPNCAAAVSCR